MAQLTPDEVLLGLLAAHQCHGYHLLEHFRDPGLLGQVWDLSTSQLYAVLKRLENQGFILGKTVESWDTPARVEYHLTPIGEERLEIWLHEKRPSASIRRVRVEFLSRLYIARLLNIPTLQITKNQKAACKQQQKQLIEERDQAQPGVGFLALELMIAQLDAILQWIDRCELQPLGDEDEAD